MLFNINYLEAEIIDQYLHDENPDRPWIIGFSGGKDSTMLLQVVWNAIKKIEELSWTRDIYIVCNDTLVENPKVVLFIEKTLKKIEEAAVRTGMPFKVIRTIPRLEDTFWVNLIGKGYPAPSNTFRWCTERLKINPTTRFILDKVSEKGEAIILLGTRSDESSSRARSIKKHAIKGNRLRKHMLPNAFVYAPIKDITTNELWQYLNQVAPPWGGTNKELVTLYRNANSGDCPLVIDETSPSCGNSRFGCWVCTVVKRDKSMEGLIDSGEEWMEPLMDFRDYLVETRENGEKYREKFGRDGREKPEGFYGPYKSWVRADFLEKLLIAQKEIQDTEGGVELISHQELVAIQVTWYRDGIFNHKVADIYNRIYNKDLDMSKQEEKFRVEEELLKKSCKQDLEELQLIQDLIGIQKKKALLLRKRGLQNDIDVRLEEYLEAKKEVAGNDN
ncbi:DNA phosphorothioation system sulfurtransferase DndC [Pontibacter indicus]|uniref:DNA sulfur modification protein DndC n=1 Tax=Pontibacter indicus TaxID=1317125 RepID=A0A1R3WVE5_9BACT|nr:DNA phosphorothioation system sulfurtransferase DndC [Pontibacter indicus]SIT81993.1 DNA sulfur modification protein DndC [Pontibacter indicus]